MICQRLDYAAVVWSRNMKKDTGKLERIQRADTMMVKNLKDLTYEDMLKEMGLLTLRYRKERGDLITLYKLINDIEKIEERRKQTDKRTLHKERSGRLRI